MPGKGNAQQRKKQKHAANGPKKKPQSSQEASAAILTEEEQQNVIESLWRDADRYFDWWKGALLIILVVFCCGALYIASMQAVEPFAMEHQSFFQNRVTSTELYITYVMHMTSLCTVMVYVQRLPSIRLMKEDYAVSLRRLKEKSPHPSVSQKWKTYFRIIDKRCLLRAAAGFSSLPAGFWGYVFCSDWLSVDGTRRYSYDDLPPLLIWLPLTSVFITVATFICVHMYMNLADEIKKMDQLKYELKGA